MIERQNDIARTYAGEVSLTWVDTPLPDAPNLQTATITTHDRVGVVLRPWGRHRPQARITIVRRRADTPAGSRWLPPTYPWPSVAVVSHADTAEFSAALRYALTLGEALAAQAIPNSGSSDVHPKLDCA